MANNFFSEHLKDLSDASEKRGIYTFTHFLNLDEQSVLASLANRLCPYTLFGGTDGNERVMARFGSPDDIGYEQPFPIVCVGISPINDKFADELTHRDILGAIMSLGLEREQIGDIAVRGKHAFVFVNADKADFICSELTKIKHTDIKCTVREFDPSAPLYKTDSLSVIAASDRLDCLVGAVFNLSRGAASELFDGGKIFINGRQTLSPSARPKIGDTVSVRGKGRFIFNGEITHTKKGRTVFSIEKFV